MQVTIETINGKLCTVIWHDGVANKWSGDYRFTNDGVGYLFNAFNRNHHIATALPALPRNPKPEDAPLLYRYMAEGLEIGFDDHFSSWDAGTVTRICSEYSKITHATHNGTRIEIAIEENADA